jgi:hypothetical protein
MILADVLWLTEYPLMSVVGLLTLLAHLVETLFQLEV